MHLSLYQFSRVFPSFDLLHQTNFEAVRSIEFPRYLFNEGDMRRGLDKPERSSIVKLNRSV
jgi:hypothetical protein